MCVVYLESKQVLLCFTVSTTHRSQSKWMFVLVLLCDMHLWFLCSVGSSLYSLILVTLFKALLIYDSVIFFFFSLPVHKKWLKIMMFVIWRLKMMFVLWKIDVFLSINVIIVTLTYHLWLSLWLITCDCHSGLLIICDCYNILW